MYNNYIIIIYNNYIIIIYCISEYMLSILIAYMHISEYIQKLTLLSVYNLNRLMKTIDLLTERRRITAVVAVAVTVVLSVVLLVQLTVALTDKLRFKRGPETGTTRFFQVSIERISSSHELARLISHRRAIIEQIDWLID